MDLGGRKGMGKAERRSSQGELRGDLHPVGEGLRELELTCMRDF